MAAGEPRISFYEIIDDRRHTTRRLVLPPTFVEKISEMPRTAILNGPSGDQWHVKIFRKENRYIIEDGWDQFIRDNSLGKHELLVFNYNERKVFDVEIFETTGLRRNPLSETSRPYKTMKGKDLTAAKRKISSPDVVKMEYGSCSGRKMLSNMKKKYPDFFQVYISEISSREMPVPEAFGVYIDGLMPLKAILRQGGRIWDVMLVRSAGNVVFQEGWEGFAKSNNLKDYDFLFFSYNGSCMFDVAIFDDSKCVKEEAEKVKPLKVEEDNDGDDEVKEKEHDNYVVNEDNDTEEDTNYVSCNGFNGETEEVEEEYDINDESINARDNNADDGDDQDEKEAQWRLARQYLSDERNPFFFAKLGRAEPKYLLVPSVVIKDFNLTFPNEVTLLDPFMREWKGCIKRWGDGRTWIDGWKTFCRWNMVTRRDLCICEILEGTERVRISIARDRV